MKKKVWKILLLLCMVSGLLLSAGCGKETEEPAEDITMEQAEETSASEEEIIENTTQ